MPDPNETPDAANTASQERSRRTLERILASAERLLADRDFRELTMQDLAAATGCAVGTLYARIPDKDALLECLHERHVRLGQELSVRVMAAAAEADLAGRAAAICGLVVDYLGASPGVTRAVTTHLFHLREDASDHRASATAALREAAKFLANGVSAKPTQRIRRDAEFALLAVLDVAEGRIVFGDRSRTQLRFSKRELKQRLTQLMLRYRTGDCP
ncbi:MAG: TetR/AcrR family transcriptional regulator [bacterium]|nr:TetR/AcrR family transcriptional regulator [bacterium]